MNLLLADAASTLHDAMASGNVWLAVVAGLCLVVPVVLHAMGKDIPFLSPLIDGLLEIAAKALSKPAAPPAPADPAKPEGLASVVDIKKDPK